MKRNSLVSALLVILVDSFTAQASIRDCPLDSVHCAYFSGFSNSVDDGRYVKLYNANIGTIVICFNGYSTVSFGQNYASQHQGANADVYSICTDATGVNCTQVAVDNFTVSKSSNGFISKPKYFSVDMSTLKSQFPACSSTRARTITF